MLKIEVTDIPSKNKKINENHDIYTNMPLMHILLAQHIFCFPSSCNNIEPHMRNEIGLPVNFTRLEN